MKRIILLSILYLFIVSAGISKAESAMTKPDSLIKGTGSVIYYYASDGFRYVFPDNKTFGSWFSDFKSVVTVSDNELANIPLKGNVTYRPGVRMVKIQTNPKVYAVDKGGKLRWVENEELAKKLYGDDWNKKIDDVSDVFFMNYIEGDSIKNTNDYNPAAVVEEVKTINKEKGIAESVFTPKGTTKVGDQTSIDSSKALTTDNGERVTVTKVIDGDTIVIEGGDHVRLIGIDADEPGYSCYYNAKERLESLILNKEVIVESDQTDKDQYGRLLRYIFIDKTNIGHKLVKEGSAVCRSYDSDTKYKTECINLEQEAKNNKMGCKWGKTDKPQPPICTELTAKKTGYDVIQANDASKYLSKYKIVEGFVVSTRRYSNPAIFINFCKPYPNHCFTSIVWDNNWSKFPSNAASLYYNKTVRVKGYIEIYEGKPQIILDNPDDIEVCQ